jgi:hypothetical protein
MQDFERAQRHLADHLRDPQRAPPEGLEDRRLQIYRDLLFNNVAGLLAGNFPVIRQLLPNDDWNALVRAYYRDHAAHTPYFHQIAQEFIAFLTAHPEAWARYPFLLELAHYEWLELALDIDPQELEVGTAGAGDWMQQPIVVSRVAQLAGYRFPVHLIRPEFQPMTPPDQPTWLLVYRNRSDKVQFQALTPLAALLWQVLSEAPRSGAQALDALRQQVPGLTLDEAALTQQLNAWEERGLVTRLA